MYDNKTLIESLGKLQPGNIPLDIFNAIAKLMVMPVVEIVIKNNRNQIFLLQRPSDDKFWPNQYHVPGKIITPNDKNIEIADIVKNVFIKLGFSENQITPIFVASKLCIVERGAEIALIYKIEVTDENVPNGLFYDSDNLPADMITGHHDFIKLALL